MSSYEVNVRHKLSFGLIAFAAILSVFLVAGLHTANVVHQRQSIVQEPKAIDTIPWSLSNESPRSQSIVERYDVNKDATHEIKKQCGGDSRAVPNPASRTFAQIAWGRPYGGDVYPGKVLPDGSVVTKVGPSYTTPPPKPVVVPQPVDSNKPQPRPTPTPTPEPDLVIPLTPSELPAKKEIQVMLFVGDDRASRAVMSWFDRDPALVDLKNSSDFQVFTPDNKLYQARFRSKYPVDKFPFVVVQDSEGGHVHIAVSSRFPQTAAELVDDINLGIRNYQSAKQGGDVKNNGRISTDGYNWDTDIITELEDCGPDGCNVDSQRRIPRPFLDWWRSKWGRDKSIEALVWVNAYEIATYAIFGLAFVLLIMIFARGNK